MPPLEELLHFAQKALKCLFFFFLLFQRFSTDNAIIAPTSPVGKKFVSISNEINSETTSSATTMTGVSTINGESFLLLF
jgi:hypothetical protein